MTIVVSSRWYQDANVSQMQTLESQSILELGDGDKWTCLTVLYHPDLSRIGERAIIGLLPKHPVTISRNNPEFSHPGNYRTRTLRDPYLSRRPIQLERIDSDTIELAPEPGVTLHVNGNPVTGPIALAASQLESGVLLHLARRVILILHTVTVSEQTPSWGLVGDSDGIVMVRQQIAQVADLGVPVLIRGETGVGKERVAQSIHAASRRADKPCVAVNMAAIAPTTAQSELFGHVKGAFTGAFNRHIGLFERADTGTLFLDEIGETPPSVQAMLLRTLAEGTIMAVGDQAERTVNVRVIAATDANIEDGGDDGSFRAALFHRLSGYEIRIPPLRERRDDIGRLAMHFLRRELDEIGEAWRIDQQATARQLWFPPGLMARLFRHDWPGNVRQLANVVRQLVISSRGSSALRVDENVERVLSEETPTRKRAQGRAAAAPVRVPPSPAPVGSPPTRRPPRRAAKDVTDDEVYEALEACNWRIKPTADKLRVARSTLYALIKRHPRIRKAKDITPDELQHWLEECNGDLNDVVRQLKVSKRGLKLRMTELGIRYERDPDAPALNGETLNGG